MANGSMADLPDLLHVVPVGHDTVLDRVLEGKDTTLGLGLVADVPVNATSANKKLSLGVKMTLHPPRCARVLFPVEKTAAHCDTKSPNAERERAVIRRRTHESFCPMPTMTPW